MQVEVTAWRASMEPQQQIFGFALKIVEGQCGEILAEDWNHFPQLLSQMH